MTQASFTRFVIFGAAPRRMVNILPLAQMHRENEDPLWCSLQEGVSVDQSRQEALDFAGVNGRVVCVQGVRDAEGNSTPDLFAYGLHKMTANDECKEERDWMVVDNLLADARHSTALFGAGWYSQQRNTHHLTGADFARFRWPAELERVRAYLAAGNYAEVKEPIEGELMQILGVDEESIEGGDFAFGSRTSGWLDYENSTKVTFMDGSTLFMTQDGVNSPVGYTRKEENDPWQPVLCGRLI